MSSKPQYDAEYAHMQWARERSPLRRFVKNFYLDNILRDVEGPTLDFGCGTGQLLARLPPGSMGIEVNGHLVDELKRRHLNVTKYDKESDGFDLPGIEVGRFKTLVLSHVLEHFDHADACLRRLLASCARVGISRVIIVVPGAKGYSSDLTHRTFVTRDYLSTHGLLACEGFRVQGMHYFPINTNGLGAYYKFHEFHVLFVRDL